MRTSDPALVTVVLEARTYVALKAKSNRELVALAIEHCMPLIDDDARRASAVLLMLEIFNRLDPKFGT